VLFGKGIFFVFHTLCWATIPMTLTFIRGVDNSQFDTLPIGFTLDLVVSQWR